jgi:hypothetical protein
MIKRLTCSMLAVSTAIAAAIATPASAAEPLVTAGIGLQTCSKLAQGMKPEEGLDNVPNYLVYYWVQGYMSAANITMLEADGEYVDLTQYDETKIIPLVYDFCTKNPDKKPIWVIDTLLSSAPKLEGEWVKGSIDWAAE